MNPASPFRSEEEIHTLEENGLNSQTFRLYSHDFKEEVDMNAASDNRVADTDTDSYTTVNDFDSAVESAARPAAGTTIPDEPESNSEKDTTTITYPGAHLRTIRQKNSLSVQHVADRLYLSPAMVNALEEDDYRSLPSSVFVRGYIRNYCRLLEIPFEPLISAYETLEQKPLPPLTPPQVKKENQASSGDSWVKAVTFSIILTLMVLTALWRFYPNNSSESTPPANPNHTQNGEEGEALPLPHPPTATPPGVSNVSDKVYVPPSENGDSAAKPSSTTPTTDPSKANSLTLYYDKPVWTKVTDSTGKEVFRGTPKDNTWTVNGTPPFTVKTRTPNAANGVTVEHNGNKISLKDAHKKGSGFIIGAPQ